MYIYKYIDKTLKNKRHVTKKGSLIRYKIYDNSNDNAKNKVHIFYLNVVADYELSSMNEIFM